MPLLSFSPLAFGGNAAILAARMNKKLEMKGMPHELDFVSKKTDTWRYKETAPHGAFMQFAAGLPLLMVPPLLDLSMLYALVYFAL
ncbi:hypothetical protein PENNAL_c0006G05350 [Penicillium nalgiovense]|uniref:Uncharacterized protein n=1 Tax=Penicillium nalgiovense TaxID=60175 RepID=A0A1V6Z0F7_PENNA|nr:hypothetical protein PENNAL_c0006G05350 [Penicillium nalgiovense]